MGKAELHGRTIGATIVRTKKKETIEFSGTFPAPSWRQRGEGFKSITQVIDPKIRR